jgi:iron complex outermembrane receptor protein
MYGANAVGGAINIITKQANRKFEGVAKAFYASFDTWGSSLNIGQNLENDNKGLSYTAYGFYRNGEGYYFDEGINFDDTDEKTHLEEYNVGGSFSYRFNPKHKVTLDYKFHDDFRGDGTQVYEPDGSYYSYTVNFGQANYQGRLMSWDVNALAYLQDEYYYRQNESVNSSNEYRLYETNSIKRDVGGLLNVSKQLNYHHQITFGLDVKSGLLHSVDDYMTSTDSIDNRGRMDFVGLYIQDELKYLNNKLNITVGVRADRANFYEGSQSVQNPSKVTGFEDSFTNTYDENSWVAISPKLAARYKFSPQFSWYASIASGFNPPKIDDLCRSGKIRKGFKLANPELEPETLWNFETGLDHSPIDAINMATSLFYSRGYNFHNLVGTGDTVDTGGAELKPVLRKLNISEVEITGVEFSFSWQVHKNFRFMTNYSYSRSLVLDFDNNSSSDDYAGNRIIEVPPHNLFAGLFYTGKLFNASLDYSYTDAIWVDIENTQSVDPYDIWNFKVSRNFGKHWNMAITIQNILDNEYIDRKERKSPGRFSMVEVSYRW